MDYFKEKEVCKHKVKYTSYEWALRASKNHSGRMGRPKHRPYECSICGGFHLATKKPEDVP